MPAVFSETMEHTVNLEPKATERSIYIPKMSIVGRFVGSTYRYLRYLQEPFVGTTFSPAIGNHMDIGGRDKHTKWSY